MRQEIGDQTGAPAGVTLAIEAAPAELATPRKAPPRLAYVDGLRALAALEVVASHVVIEIWRKAPTQQRS